ncbi:MAG: PorT family protein [Candidatus Cloacimonetes bacterium]|nr:PorT family protein [Candidatus Cloacimonadota bacterium]
MKKFTLLFVICVTTLSLFAQGDPNYSVFGGFTSSWGTDTFSDAKSKAGFHAGLSYMNRDFIPGAIIEPGVRITTRGLEYSESDYYDYKFEMNLLYLDGFIKAKLDIPDFPIQPYAGFQAGILLSAEAKVAMYGQSETTDIKDDMNTMDFGLLFGADVVFQKRFSVGFEYTLGLSNIMDIGTDETKNRTILLSIGLLF